MIRKSLFCDSATCRNEQNHASVCCQLQPTYPPGPTDYGRAFFVLDLYSLLASVVIEVRNEELRGGQHVCSAGFHMRIIMYGQRVLMKRRIGCFENTLDTHICYHWR